jgi:two-component system, cell cycle sensor histidine kinase and response regulator CckA
MIGEFFGGNEGILLVDDEALLIDVGTQMMEKLGYTVFTAMNGQTAIDAYTSKQDMIQMVVLDMMMPDMGGRDVYESLKEINSGVRVLLSSGYSVDGEAAEIMGLGCDGFIQKPFNLKHLSIKIREILDGNPSEENLQMAS